jgi:hypothetical protein
VFSSDAWKELGKDARSSCALNNRRLSEGIGRTWGLHVDNLLYVVNVAQMVNLF